jgi:hypothetical protein
MVPHQAVYSFIISNRIPGSKLNDYFAISISLKSTLGIIKQKDVIRISKKLKLSIQFRVICYRKHLSASIVQLHLSEIDRITVKAHLKSVSMPLQRYRHLIPTFALNLEVSRSPSISKARREARLD